MCTQNTWGGKVFKNVGFVETQKRNLCTKTPKILIEWKRLLGWTLKCFIKSVKMPKDCDQTEHLREWDPKVLP